MKRNNKGQFKKNNTPWNKGKKMSKVFIEKMSESRLGQEPWNKGMKGYLSGDSNPKWKGGLPKCEDCEKELSRYDAVRCSGCNKKFLRGKNHPNWNGGSNQRDENGSYKHKEWAKTVYKRDHYTCQRCGKHCNEDIQAHHIKTWKDYPEDRFDVRNGITLCFDCHLPTRSVEDKYENDFRYLVAVSELKYEEVLV